MTMDILPASHPISMEGSCSNLQLSCPNPPAVMFLKYPPGWQILSYTQANSFREIELQGTKLASA